MANQHKLTPGAINAICKGNLLHEPILQVLAIKVPPGNRKSRVLISDGTHRYRMAFITAKEKFTVLSIIKLLNYEFKAMNDKMVILIEDYNVLANGDHIGRIIGDPQDVAETSAVNQENEPPAKRVNISHQRTTTTANVPPPKNTAMQSNGSDPLIVPIAALKPYQQKWVIKARVTSKSPIRSWSNEKGEGKLFTVDLLDESGEIRATGFKEAVDKFYELLQVEKIFYISKCFVKLANKQYASFKNDYEIKLGYETVIRECEEADDSSIPKIKYNFIPLQDINKLPAETTVDVIGVCKWPFEMRTIVTKAGKELSKRDFVIVDSSKASITLSLWGETAETTLANESTIIAVKGGRINEYEGSKSITVPADAIVKCNPDIQEANELRSWYDNGGSNEKVTNISERVSNVNKLNGGSAKAGWLTLKEARDQALAENKSIVFRTKGTLLQFKAENCCYKACPTQGCNKKVIDLENGQYRCEKCDTNHSNFNYRLLANMNIADWSDSEWVIGFSEVAERVLGRKAEKVGKAAALSEEHLQAIANEANFKEFVYKMSTSIEVYNDEPRTKTVVLQVAPIDYVKYNKQLLVQIKENCAFE